MISNIVISAAGRGTRMGELSEHKPKHLIEVAGRPFLTYVLDSVVAAGFTHIYIVVGYQASATYDFLQLYSLPASVQVTIINQFERLGEDKYGTLMPLVAVVPELTGQSVVAVNSDNLYSVTDLQQMARVTGSAVVGQEHDTPERYGVLVPRVDGTLERIIEKPVQPPSRLINTGLYTLSPAIWDTLSQVQKSARGEYELTDAINYLCQQESVQIIKLTGYWLDFGRPEDIGKVEEILREKLKNSN